MVKNGLVATDDNQYKGAIPFSRLEAFGKSNKPLPYVDTDDPAFILFTSGTTGNPKGAVLTSHGLVNGGYLIAYLNNMAKHNMICCCPIPVFHCFGLIEGAIHPFISGGKTVFPAFFPDTLQTMKAIHEDRCTSIKGAPVIFNDIINHPDRLKYDLSSLKYMVIGASTIPKDLLLKARDILKIEHIAVGYGLTETS